MYKLRVQSPTQDILCQVLFLLVQHSEIRTLHADVYGVLANYTLQQLHKTSKEQRQRLGHCHYYHSVNCELQIERKVFVVT